MKWETYKLKQLCSEIVDCVNKTAPTSDVPTPYKMLRTSDIRDGKINLENLNCVTKEVYEKWTRRGKLQKGDVIFTREAPLGEVGLVREEKNYFLGQRLVLFRANNKMCDGRFLMYSLLWHDNKQAIISKGVGSTVAHLRVPECENIEIKVPDLDAQHRIADILSAYDDLIENNQRQIKLLEEAAQRLYKEWFVDLRFPGHENTKIVDGVPEGWRISSIYDVFDIKYGKNLPTSKITKAGQYPVYGASGVIGYYNEKNCDDYATLVTSRGNGSGDVFRTHHKQSYITNNSFIARRNDKNSFIENEFTFQLFSNTDFKKLCTGSAQPQLTNTSIQKIKILLPNRQLIEKYQRCTIEMSEKQEALYQEQRALTQARNRLLPKLMNGTVEV
ncbi:MAG: restriction endonuclease subunit S [Faecalibacterium prausnitzii]